MSDEDTAETSESDAPVKKECPPEEEEEAPCHKYTPLPVVLIESGKKIPQQPRMPDCENLIYRASQLGIEKPPPPPPETSRDFRIYKAMNTKEWGNVCECHGAKDQAILELLSISITTIMLMAIKHDDIKESQLRWTANCLENVRNDNGEVPPNIRCILNMINAKLPPEEDE